MPKHREVNQIRDAKGDEQSWKVGDTNSNNNDYVWFWHGDTKPYNRYYGVRYTPDQAEEIAYMLLYEAKLVREAQDEF